ncbi:MAG: arylsulfotransferase family protein [Alphaproteobacteria bacterium]|nr:arylsulfotransferase family protein [Alphaproteobacteria bacterium]
MKTRRYADILWFALLGVVLFGAGIVYQWFVNKHPIYPLTVPGNVLDSSKKQVADTLHRFGLKKPSYYYQTDFTQDSIWHDPSAADAGLTLVTAVNADQRLEARIIELDGTPVHTWSIDWFDLWPDAAHVPEIFAPKQQPGTHIHGAVIMDNGDLVFNFEYQGMLRLDMCGDVVWRLPYQTHHSIDLDEDTGNLWVSGRIFHDQPDPEFPNHMPTYAEPTVLEVSPDGEILKEISVIELLEKNDLHGLLYMDDFDDIQRGRAKTTGDTLHLNDVEVFPSTLAPGRFKPGDLMLSLRNIHTVLVFDPVTEEITFRQSGGFVGQHDPDFIDGDRISVFDNAVAIGEDAVRESRVVILSAAEDHAEPEVYYQGSDRAPFYTDVMGKHQWLPNGNLLLTESTKGRAFEIDQNGEIVWQHVNLVDDDGWVGLVDEAQRLPIRYDQTFFEGQRRQRCDGSRQIATGSG